MSRGAPIGIGIVLALVGAVLVRMFGAALIDPLEPMALVWLYAALVPGTALLVWLLFGLLKVPGDRRLEAIALVALPGLLLDSVLLLLGEGFFGTFWFEQLRILGSWLLAAYGLSLLAALIVPAGPAK